MPTSQSSMFDSNNNATSQFEVDPDDGDSEDDLFEGYSYVAPSIILDDGPLKTTTTTATTATAGHRLHKPDIAKLVESCYSGAGGTSNEFFLHYDLVVSGTDPGQDVGRLGDGSFSICRR